VAVEVVAEAGELTPRPFIILAIEFVEDILYIYII
jgi:hypothetical protein